LSKFGRTRKSCENTAYGWYSHSTSLSPKLSQVFLQLDRNTVHVFYFNEDNCTYVLPLCWTINCTFIWQMSLGILSVLVLLTVSLSGVDGINGTVSPSVSNSSSAVNVSITTVPTTQITTELSTNATPQNATPGIKIGECYGFDVFVLNNQLNIPYTVTCCIAVLCGFYLILFGKICRNKHVWVLVSETVNLVHLSLFCRPET